MPDPFSADFLDQLKEKEKVSSSPAEKKAPDAKASEAIPKGSPEKDKDAASKTEIKEIKDGKDRLLQRIPFKEGKMDGTMEVYNPDTGALTHKMPYVQATLEGTVQVYGTDQKVIQEIPYVQGQKKGIARFYHKGSKTSEITYEEDKMKGPAIFYGPNEVIHTLSNYKDNQLDGDFSLYDAKKNLLRTCSYAKGLLEGPSKTFYPSKELLEECTYKENKIQGQQIQYFEDGTLMRRMTYNNDGKIIKEEAFSPKGAKLTEKDIDPTPQKTL